MGDEPELSLYRAALALHRRRQAREHFLDYICYTKPDYQVNWHHRLCATKLEEFEAKVRAKLGPRLIIRMPPRGGKSEQVSRRYPGWVLGRNPDWQIIETSYNDKIAADMGGDARQIIETPEYADLFDTTLRADSSAKDNWRTEQGGVYIAAGVGGGITGRGAHCLLVDDPYKDAADAWSGAVRKRIWDWFTTTAFTRLMPGGGVILLLTSWHDDGLDNKLIRTAKETGEAWEVIDIPALMEADYAGRHPDDPREPGESFWPSAWPLETLEVTRRRVGPNAWSALYQQRAIPAGGSIIDRSTIKLWDRYPEGMDEIILSWDLAFKGHQDSCRVAGHVWGKRGGDFFLLHRDTRIREFTDTLDAFVAMANRFPLALVKLVEDAANGPALQSVLQSRIPGITMVPADRDKESRLRAVSPVFFSGNVYLPNPAIHPWAAELIEELVRFPNSEYNDDTDALTQALAYWVVPGYGPTRWKEWTL